MSWSIDLFIITKKTLQSVAEDVGRTLNLPVKIMDSDEEVYSLEKREAQLDVGRNEQVNDRDLLLESYDIIVSIWSTKLPDWQVSEEECRNIGVTLFENFRETYRTSLLLTENSQKRLMTFDPAL